MEMDHVAATRSPWLAFDVLASCGFLSCLRCNFSITAPQLHRKTEMKEIFKSATVVCAAVSIFSGSAYVVSQGISSLQQSSVKALVAAEVSALRPQIEGDVNAGNTRP